MVKAIKILCYITLTIYAIAIGIFVIVSMIVGINNNTVDLSIITFLIILIFYILFNIITILTLKKIKKSEKIGKIDGSFLILGILNIIFVDPACGILCILLQDSHFYKKEEINCPYCGEKILSDSIFCCKCGLNIKGDDKNC